MIFILTQDTDAFAPAFKALQKLAGFNAPTASYPWQGSQGRIYATPDQEAYNRMMQDFNDPKKGISHQFVMTEQEARDKIANAYSGNYKISEESFVSDWQAAKKIYHSPEFGLDPEDYGMTKDDLKSIQKHGLTRHVQAGRLLPSIEFIRDYQKAIKTISKADDKLSGWYDSSGENMTHDSNMYLDRPNRRVAVFKKSTGDLIVARKCNRPEFDRLLATRRLGKLL